MGAKVVLLLRCLQRIVKPLEAVCRKQLRFGNLEIGVYNQMRLDNVGDIFFPDPSRGMVGRAVLGDCGPVVGLEDSEVSRRLARGAPQSRMCSLNSHGQQAHR
jgi:hypothetical protein